MNSKIASIYYHNTTNQLRLNAALTKLNEVTAKAQAWLDSIDERTYEDKLIWRK